jgi:SAM-dependent methyltransferase
MVLREGVAALISSIRRKLKGNPPRKVIHHIHEWLRDHFLGIETRALDEVPDADLAKCPDAHHSQATSYGVLSHVLRSIAPDDVFVDLGCGRGRVVCYVASRMRLRKVIGVELMAKMAEFAKQNAAKARLLTPVEIVQGNAAIADLSEGTAYFLFNPFGEETLRQVLANIRRSIAASPRTIRILYYNPLFEGLLDACDWLKAEETIELPFARVSETKKPFLRIWRSTV